jgi:membrane protease YdiL (CAAX protease family)
MEGRSREQRLKAESRRKHTMNLLQRYPITSFFVLAFVLAWGIRITMNVASIEAPPLKLLAEFAPAIAALIVTRALTGKGSARTLLGREKAWRLHPWWYALVLLGPAALQLVSIGLFVLFGGPGVQFQFPGLVFLFTLIIGLLSATGEEIGWRGFAFPRLQARSNLVVASLIIGTLWACWHIPDDLTNLGLLAVPSTYIGFLWFLGLNVIGSLFMGWVYNRTGGSLFLMVLAHLGLTIFWKFVILPEQVGQFRPDYLSVILMGIVVVIVAVFTVTKKRTPAQLPEQVSTGAQQSVG